MNRPDSDFESAKYGSVDFDYDFDKAEEIEPSMAQVQAPAVAHALAWATAPRNNLQKLVNLSALKIIMGVSNSFCESASISCDRSTIQKAVKRACREFGIR